MIGWNDPERKIIAQKISASLLEALNKDIIKINTYGHDDESVFINNYERLLDPRNFELQFYQEDCLKFIQEIGVEKSKTGNYLKDWMSLSDFGLLNSSCYKCGERLSWMFNGKVIMAHTLKIDDKTDPYTTPQCRFSNGIIDITAEINIDSGHLLIANDLRHIFTDNLLWKNDRWKKENSVNHFAGKMRLTERSASVGLLTSYIGGGNAHIYYNGEDSIIIKNYRSDKIPKRRPKNHKKIGIIILDLRWFGAADYQRCKDLNSEQVEKSLVSHGDKLFYAGGQTIHKIPMTPGRYRMLHKELDEDYRVSISRIK